MLRTIYTSIKLRILIRFEEFRREREKEKKLHYIHYLIRGLRNKKGFERCVHISTKEKEEAEKKKHVWLFWQISYHIDPWLKCDDSQHFSFFISINRLILVDKSLQSGLRGLSYGFLWKKMPRYFLGFRRINVFFFYLIYYWHTKIDNGLFMGNRRDKREKRKRKCEENRLELLRPSEKTDFSPSL